MKLSPNFPCCCRCYVCLLRACRCIYVMFSAFTNSLSVLSPLGTPPAPSLVPWILYTCTSMYTRLQIVENRGFQLDCACSCRFSCFVCRVSCVVSCISVSCSPCLVPRVSCLIFGVLCLASRVSFLACRVSHLPSPVSSCLSSYSSRLASCARVSCLLSRVSFLLYRVSCLV